MPSAGEHDAPLRLTTGADGQLAAGWRSVAALAALAILLMDHPVLLRAALLAALAGTLVLVERGHRRSAGRRVVILRDRRCQLDGEAALLLAAAWLSNRYALIRARDARRQRHLLISATRQEPGEYRKLLAWMRLQPWNSD